MLISELDLEFGNNKSLICDTLNCDNSATSVLWLGVMPDVEPKQFACDTCEQVARDTDKFPATR
jgi:hypothetical protein